LLWGLQPKFWCLSVIGYLPNRLWVVAGMRAPCFQHVAFYTRHTR
jgi:hypothetical protein